jgi:hypothetical protein
MPHSRLRRSISCMAAGLLIIVPATVFFWGDLVDWHPDGVVVLVLGFVCIAGIIWLYDEVRDIRAEQKLASIANENPFRARDAKTFDRGAKINRWVDELRRVAAKKLTGSDIAVALQTALGNEVAAQVLRENPNYSPDQKRYVIDEVLNAVCPGVRKAAYMEANLPDPPSFDEGRDLTSEEFHQLTLRIINAAMNSNAPVSDAITATAKAMGAMICILAERPGTSAEDLIKFCQQAIAEYTQHAIAERAAQRSSGPTT